MRLWTWPCSSPGHRRDLQRDLLQPSDQTHHVDSNALLTWGWTYAPSGNVQKTLRFHYYVNENKRRWSKFTVTASRLLWQTALTCSFTWNLGFFVFFFIFLCSGLSDFRLFQVIRRLLFQCCFCSLCFWRTGCDAQRKPSLLTFQLKWLILAEVFRHPICDIQQKICKSGWCIGGLPSWTSHNSRVNLTLSQIPGLVLNQYLDIAVEITAKGSDSLNKMQMYLSVQTTVLLLCWPFIGVLFSLSVVTLL